MLRCLILRDDLDNNANHCHSSISQDSCNSKYNPHSVCFDTLPLVAYLCYQLNTILTRIFAVVDYHWMDYSMGCNSCDLSRSDVF